MPIAPSTLAGTSFPKGKPKSLTGHWQGSNCIFVLQPMPEYPLVLGLSIWYEQVGTIMPLNHTQDIILEV